MLQRSIEPPPSPLVPEGNKREPATIDPDKLLAADTAIGARTRMLGDVESTSLFLKEVDVFGVLWGDIPHLIAAGERSGTLTAK